MATDVISAIKADGTGDYTTLTAWEAARNVDISLATGSDKREIAEVYDTTTTASFGSVEWLGGTHDEANGNYLLIRPAAGGRFDPKTQLGNKLVSAAGDPTHGFVVRSNQILYIEDLGIEVSGSSNFMYYGNPGILRLYRCCVNLTKSGVSAAKTNTFFYNCQIIPGSIGANSSGAGGTIFNATLKNCTVIGKNGYGSYGGDILIHNCACTNVVAYNSKTSTTYNTFHSSSGNYNAQNADGSANAPGANSLQNIVTTDFTNFATNDYSVASASQLIDAGTTLAEFTDDINGTVRG